MSTVASESSSTSSTIAAAASTASAVTAVDACMSSEYNRLAEILVSRYRDKKSRLIVGLSGPPGAGKSTTSSRLVDLLSAHVKAVVLPMDGYHFTKEALSKFPDPTEAFRRRGSHWTFDSARFVADLMKLKIDSSSSLLSSSSSSLLFPSFDHAIGDPIEDDIIVNEDVEVIIIEGNYLLMDIDPWSTIKTHIADVSIFISCDEEVLRSRVISRHMQAHPEQSLEMASMRFESNDLLNARLISESRTRADFIISSL